MENEVEVGNRKLSPKEQGTLRLKIILVEKKNLWSNGTIKAKVVAEIYECSVSHVSHTWKKYRENSVSGLRSMKMVCSAEQRETHGGAASASEGANREQKPGEN